MKLGKMEIVSILAGFHGYTSYLEICTPTTAGIFSLLDTARFTKIHRLVYDASDQFDDGAPVELRSPTRDIEPCLAELSRRGERYDVILVDPYHDYECSYRDLALAFRFLNDNGVVVIHDVLPPSSGRFISPTFVPGGWCGLTFIAYVDFSRLPEDALSQRSRLIMTYALCGFANFGSLGILIGGMGAMVPERRAEIVALGLRSILSGTLATCMSGAVVGLLL